MKLEDFTVGVAWGLAFAALVAIILMALTGCAGWKARTEPVREINIMETQ